MPVFSFPDKQSKVPSMLQNDRFMLRPLRVTDVELDYDAVMSSRAMLRAWSQSDWPADDFTLEGNLADLDRHQNEHEAGETYTYTMMNLDGTSCLGCVYINPLPPALQELVTIPDQTHLQSGHTAFARFWIRRSLQQEKLDRELLSALQEWFHEDWHFTHLFFRVSPVDNHQHFLFTSAGLSRALKFEDQGDNVVWWAFS